MFIDIILKINRLLILSYFMGFNIKLAKKIIERGIEKGYRFSIYIDENLTRLSFERLLNETIMKEICIMPNCKDYNYVVALISNPYNFTLVSNYQRFIVFMPQKPRNLLNRNIFDEVCNTRKSSSYISMICRHSNFYLFRVENNDIIEEHIPNTMISIYNDLKEYVTMYGSIKASDFSRYIAKKYGYSKEEAIKIIRDAINLGIFRYSYGYLSPGIEIEQ